MNTRSLLLCTLVASHFAVIVGSYQLGLRILPTPIPTVADARTPSLTPERSRRPLSLETSKPSGAYSQRLQAALDQTTSMSAQEVLTSLKHLRHLPESPDKFLTEQALLARYAEIDPETALTYVDRLVGARHSMGAQTVMSAWAAKDPEAAGRHFEENASDFGILDETERETAGAVAAEWASQDPEAAMAWADQLSPEVQGEAYSRIVSELAAADPTQAVALVDSMPEGIDRREMLETLASQWTYQDPQASIHWLDTMDESDRNAAMPKVMSAWMETDPMAASRWIATTPDSAAKDSSILAMTQSAALRRDPEAAIAWSAAIQDTSARTEALQAAAKRWMRNDPESANAWLSEDP